MVYDPTAHYRHEMGPVDEFGDGEECPTAIRNVGWTLGNDCPYLCHHCYSMSARRKGRDLTTAIVDCVVEKLAAIKVETVNLGGNEPLFTNGLDTRKTLLPYVIERIVNAGIEVGLTTSGITLLHLYRHHRAAFDLLNDIDISVDSPIEEEHDANRGAKLYHQAIEALRICQEEAKPHTIVTAAMNWNLTKMHIEKLVKLAHTYDANVRINPIKPVEPRHLEVALTPQQYFTGFAYLLECCHSVDLGEPPLAAVTNHQDAKRCPCGRTSFRVHSITPEGNIYVSPCVYLHDYKSPYDLLEYDLIDIIYSAPFRVFRQRNRNPHISKAAQTASCCSSAVAVARRVPTYITSTEPGKDRCAGKTHTARKNTRRRILFRKNQSSGTSQSSSILTISAPGSDIPSDCWFPSLVPSWSLTCTANTATTAFCNSPVRGDFLIQGFRRVVWRDVNASHIHRVGRPIRLPLAIGCESERVKLCTDTETALVCMAVGI